MLTTIAILVGAGIVLLALEVILPGAVMGIAGGIALFAALIATFASEEMTNYGAGTRLGIAGGIIGITILFLVLWMKNFHRLPWIGKYILTAEIPNPDKIINPENLLGAVGKARTDLRPAGQAIIEGKRLEVFAESGMIAHGRTISVVRIDGYRIIVREVITVEEEMTAMPDATA